VSEVSTQQFTAAKAQLEAAKTERTTLDAKFQSLQDEHKRLNDECVAKLGCTVENLPTKRQELADQLEEAKRTFRAALGKVGIGAT